LWKVAASNCRKQWEVTYNQGRKTGMETFWDEDCRKRRERRYASGGQWTWTMFDAAARITAESRWKGNGLIEANPEGPLARV
jgi:hypothetical protein